VSFLTSGCKQNSTVFGRIGIDAISNVLYKHRVAKIVFIVGYIST
jgi:hypothetical protein